MNNVISSLPNFETAANKTDSVVISNTDFMQGVFGDVSFPVLMVAEQSNG